MSRVQGNQVQPTIKNPETNSDLRAVESNHLAKSLRPHLRTNGNMYVRVQYNGRYYCRTQRTDMHIEQIKAGLDGIIKISRCTGTNYSF